MCKPASFDYIAWATEELRGDHPMVEFRHRSWLEEANRAQVFSFLEEIGATYVVVDAPKTDAKNLVPTVLARTSPMVYVRTHGRNAETWNVRGRSAAERFDYLYSEEELRELVPGGARARLGRPGGLCDVQQQRPLPRGRKRPFRAGWMGLPGTHERPHAAENSRGAVVKSESPPLRFKPGAGAPMGHLWGVVFRA